MFRLALALGFGATMLVTSCDRGPSGTGSSSEVEAKPGTNRQAYEVKGLIVALKPGEKSVEIKHEAIPGYMPAMTMPFDVKDTNELAGLQAGQRVSFRLQVTDTEGWIDRIQKLSETTNSIPTNGLVRLARNVDPLQLGDTLPDYHFVDQFGKE